MTGLLENRQTSWNNWETSGTARMYHRQKPAPEPPSGRVQLSDLADLDSQVLRFEAQHDQLMGEIRRLYVMADERSVADYLRSHRRVPQLLVDAVPSLRRFFENAPISLLAKSDENGWDMLYATVQWPGEPQDALAALDRFDDAWWLANSYPAGTTLTFTYKLV
jgi:hypothetical protein